MPTSAARHRAAAGLTAVLLLTGTATATAAVPAAVPASSSTTEQRRGPDPTDASIAVAGTFSVSRTSVPRSAVSGFGGATVYAPTDTSQGTFGAVVVAPGFTATQSSTAWLGPRLASHGFVVVTIDTLTTLDSPTSRGAQLRAALRWVTTSSSVRGQVDPARLAVVGHSMGGGGALRAAADQPSLRAVVAMTPYNLDTTWPEVVSPTLVLGAQRDTVAPVATHARTFYASIPASTPKEYLEIAGADHHAPTSGQDPTVATYATAWLKRWVDGDTRYARFLCPPPAKGTTFSAVQSNCT